MRDMIFKTFAEAADLGEYVVEDYMSNMGDAYWKNIDNKKFFGVIIDPDDSRESIDAVIDTALHASANILMFDINFATGRQISHIRNMMKKRSCRELTDLYATRIAFAKD